MVLHFFFKQRSEKCSHQCEYKDDAITVLLGGGILVAITATILASITQPYNLCSARFYW